MNLFVWVCLVVNSGCNAMTICYCFDHGEKHNWDYPHHGIYQDRTTDTWFRLVELINKTAADKMETLTLNGFDREELRDLYTLPAEIGNLTNVKRLDLRGAGGIGSNLSSLPPEIGKMSSLELLMARYSYKLHWLPYEIMQCANLTECTFSTKALYGNVKYRWPFPSLDKYPVYDYADCSTCGVCGKDDTENKLEQYWITLEVGTNHLPLLVHVCSDECRQQLPKPPAGFVAGPHKGGADLLQQKPWLR